MDDEAINKKIRNWSFGIFSIGAIFWLVMTFLTTKDTSEIASANYLKNFNISFSGVVTERQFLDWNRGLYTLNLSYSTVQDYDPRDSLNFYYCIIKGNKAEVIEAHYDIINISDSLTVNGVTDSFKVYRSGKIIKQERLYVSDFGQLMNKVKKLHKL